MRRAWPIGLAGALALAGCLTGNRTAVTAPLSSMQRSAMQTKELPGDFDTAYKAAISVLQDEGWQIDAVDRDSGLIQAGSTRYQDVIGPDDDARTNAPVIQKTRAKMAQFKGSKDVSRTLWTRWDRLTAQFQVAVTK